MPAGLQRRRGSPAVRAWPFLRACEMVTSPTEPPSQPFAFNAAASASPTPLAPVVVVGDDEGDVVAAIGADIGDDDRDLGVAGELQHARRGRGVGRRDDDAGDAAGDGVLRVAQLGLGVVVRIQRLEGVALLGAGLSTPLDR